MNAALKSNMETALTSSNTFRMSSVSNYLKPFIKPDYLAEQSSSTILSVAKTASDKFIQPNHYQMQVMTEKVGFVMAVNIFSFL